MNTRPLYFPMWKQECLNWKYWIGKVSGSEEDIKKALETFPIYANRQPTPNDMEKLAKLIREQRHQSFTKDLECKAYF